MCLCYKPFQSKVRDTEIKSNQTQWICHRRPRAGEDPNARLKQNVQNLIRQKVTQARIKVQLTVQGSNKGVNPIHIPGNPSGQAGGGTGTQVAINQAKVHRCWEKNHKHPKGKNKFQQSKVEQDNCKRDYATRTILQI